MSGLRGLVLVMGILHLLAACALGFYGGRISGMASGHSTQLLTRLMDENVIDPARLATFDGGMYAGKDLLHIGLIHNQVLAGDWNLLIAQAVLLLSGMLLIPAALLGSKRTTTNE